MAEMFDAKYVATAMSVSSQVNWTCNFIIGISFPYLNLYLGAYSFVPFATVLFCTFMFVLIWLPETQGTTPEELQKMLVSKNSGTNISVSIEQGQAINPIDAEWKMAMDQLRADEEKAMKEGTYDYGFKPIEG